MISYLILLLIAAYANIKADDWRGMMLCVVVGFGISVPIPDQNFYAWCVAVELIVAFCAVFLNSYASYSILVLSLTLAVAHYFGFRFDGYPKDSPYHIIVKIAEHAELIACAVFSKTILGSPKHADT